MTGESPRATRWNLAFRAGVGKDKKIGRRRRPDFITSRAKKIATMTDKGGGKGLNAGSSFQKTKHTGENSIKCTLG